MGPEVLALLLRRLDLEPALLYAEETRDVLGAALEHLLARGLLRETTPSRFTTCWGCGGSHMVQVIPVSPPGRTERILFLPCPECGTHRIDPGQLRRWALNVLRLAEVIAGAAGINGPSAEAVADRLWHLGRASWAGRPRDAYLARNLSDESLPPVAAELSRAPKAVLFLPTQEAVRSWAGSLPNLTLSLEVVLAPGPGGLLFDRAYVESRLKDAEPAPPAAPRPRKRAERAAKIEQLVKALQEHLRAARDHAWASRDATGAVALLPRPSQQDLARLTGLTSSAVSRCLQDEDANYLRFLWEAADSIEQVLHWDSNRRGGAG
jgi:hypothetical protein